jgi:hypothetical protein
MVSGVKLANVGGLEAMVHQIPNQKHREKEEIKTSAFSVFAWPRMNPRGPRHGWQP